MIKCYVFLLLLSLSAILSGQGERQVVSRTFEEPLATPELAADQIRQYLFPKVSQLPAPASAEEWRKEAGTLRRHIVNDVILRGWPKEWIDAPARFEPTGSPIHKSGYTMQKLRFEILPGFASTALLYLPAKIQGKAPAILNVYGHSRGGKAEEYLQKQNINFALRGFVSLTPEWVGMGELAHDENDHFFAAHLELAGLNAAGLFYLSLRKTLDYLTQRPEIDASRIGMTGLSGGGWQTIILSSLDERIAVSIPVAGYSSVVSRIERSSDIGDIEQNPTDFYHGQDYTFLSALLAPRPALLIDNAEDTCCFRAALVKPYIYDSAIPFYKLFHATDRFDWYENTTIRNHNYGKDNREQAYGFFAHHLKFPAPAAEMPVSAEIGTLDDSRVGIPKDNLTILELARQVAMHIGKRPQSDREQLRETVRLHETTVRHAWGFRSTNRDGVESIGYRFDFAAGPGASGVWVRSTESEPTGISIVLNDSGKQKAGTEVVSRAMRGDAVLAVDLLFTGDMLPRNPGPLGFAQLIAASGDRPLGLEAAQLIALAHWMRARVPGSKVRLDATGIRSQMIAQVAAALDPELFLEVTVRDGMKSLSYLFEKPVMYADAPDLFCFGFYSHFDITDLERLAAPVKIQLWEKEN